jgi:hypothetical protein
MITRKQMELQVLQASKKSYKRNINMMMAISILCVGNSSILSYQTLGNASMVPTKLQWHLHIKHADCKDKPIIFF